MSTTTYSAPGTVPTGPGRSGQRTAADVLADTVSLLVLLALGGFAIAVSFRHTMQFVRAHGQAQEWVVVGTALTVVGLTVQAGLETYRDSRAGRGRGWPAVLLCLAISAELYANAATAPAGFLARLVAAWPVLIAAAALALWTRRLQHAAEAAESAGDTVSARLWEIPRGERARFAEAVRGLEDGRYAERDDQEDEHELADEHDQEDEHELADEHDQEDEHDELADEHDQEDEHELADEHDQEDEHDELADELAALETARDRAALILARRHAAGEDLPGPTALGKSAGCSKQYASFLLAEFRDRPEHQPGQTALDEGMFAAAAA